MDIQVKSQKNKIMIFAEDYLFSRCTFKVLMVLVTALTAVPFINEVVHPFMDVMLVYGLAIVGFELFTGKLLSSLKSTKTVAFLGAFSVFYAITILINKTHIVGGFKSLAFMALFFVLFFLFPKENTKQQVLKEMKVVSATIVIITSIYSAVSFVLYVLSISGTYTNSSGTYQAYYGMFESRLWGIYNPNTSATLTIISIVLSVIFIIAMRKKATTIVLSINIFIQFCVLLLTGSRAGCYVLAGAVAFGLFMAIIRLFSKVTIKALAISLLSVTASVFVFFMVCGLLREGLAYVPGVTAYVFDIDIDIAAEQISEEAGCYEIDNEERKIDKIDLDRFDELDDDENTVFANRLDIWQACMQEFKKAPLLGIGRENVVERATENLEDKKWSYHFKFGNTHNIYLCVLVSSGIIGFLLMGSFAGATVIRSAKKTIKTYKNINIWFLSSFMLCLMMYATEFVESRILYKICIFSTVFWIYCGYMYRLSKAEDTQIQEQHVLN